MDFTFWVGIIGSLVLVAGAARPTPNKKHILSIKSTKDRLFAIGGLIMLIYAYIGYIAGGSVFFVILEIFVLISSILMMLDTNDKIDTSVLVISGTGLVIRSLYLFQGYTTLIFIVGLIILGLGYAFAMGTIRRDIALTIGSILLALFSYIEPNWIFFGLNLFFGLFSGYYLVQNLRRNFLLKK